jgi:hypothetical protein
MRRIFPISDVPSARLMRLKAMCLYRAGILTSAQRQAIACQADEMLGGSPTPSFRTFPYDSRAA